MDGEAVVVALVQQTSIKIDDYSFNWKLVGNLMANCNVFGLKFN